MKKSRRENVMHRESVSERAVEPSGVLASGASLQTIWDAFWFTPQSAQSLVTLQRVVCAVAALWFVGQWQSSSFWWGADSFGAADFSGRLEGFTEGEFPARFRWSPLWMTNAFSVIVLWCLGGICLALAAAMNIGGRAGRGLLALTILLLAQRLTWSNGTAEPYLIALAAYLTIARLSTAEDWSNRFAVRLIQVHTWLLLCTSLASQLAFQTWWQGDAVWWLAASGRSSFITTKWFEGRELLVNVLTHGITLSTAVAVGSLGPWATESSPWRYRCGLWSGLMVAIAYAVVADQLLFGCLLAGAITTWKPIDKKS